MGLFDYALLFICTYAYVFLLGFNSKNVQQSRYMSAFFVSWGITISNYFFVTYAASEGGLIFILVSGLGGSLGIVTAIYIHDWCSSHKVVRKGECEMADILDNCVMSKACKNE